MAGIAGWLAAPLGSIAAISFLSSSRGASANREFAPVRRVQSPAPERGVPALVDHAPVSECLAQVRRAESRPYSPRDWRQRRGRDLARSVTPRGVVGQARGPRGLRSSRHGVDDRMGAGRRRRRERPRTRRGSGRPPPRVSPMVADRDDLWKPDELGALGERGGRGLECVREVGGGAGRLRNAEVVVVVGRSRWPGSRLGDGVVAMLRGARTPSCPSTRRTCPGTRCRSSRRARSPP